MSFPVQDMWELSSSAEFPGQNPGYLPTTAPTFGNRKTVRLPCGPQPQSVELLPGKGIMYTDLKFVSAASDTLVPILGAGAETPCPSHGHRGHLS